ncbi:MAG: hypothetical protein KAS94_00305 [Desulfobulbaceae bacterium]|nr:hypothetical protein [Desulfobulbaceae bacterium]
MKKLTIKLSLLFSVSCLVIIGQAHAADFWDIFTSEVTTVGVNSSIDVKVNSSNVTATFIDTNSNGIFEPGETLSGSVVILNRKDAVAVTSPADLTRADLSTWANANFYAILDELFPQGLSEITGATDDSMLIGATVRNNIFAKIVPSPKQASDVKETSQDAMAMLEYIDLEVDNEQGDAASMVFVYARENDSGLVFSATLPYRYTTMEDDLESQSQFLGLDFSVKSPFKEWPSSSWDLGLSVFGSAYLLGTQTVDKSGNLKYGAAVFTSLKHDIGFGLLSYGMDYRIAKAYLPSSLNSDNEFMRLAVEYINDKLEPTQTLSYGFSLALPFQGGDSVINLQVLRSSFLSDDVPDGQENSTVVNVSGAYYPTDTFEVNFGADYTFELDDVERLGIMLGVIQKF